jgi:hypothetical protein
MIQRSESAKKSWIDFKGLCQKTTCRRFLEPHEGLFCANFLSRRGGFAPCMGAWCPGCYVPLGIKRFPIRQLIDNDGEELIEEKDSARFSQARAGDHLMTPFQCETCHVRNLLGRNLRPDKASDIELKEMIRRANLDAFWSREKSTVSSNLMEA